MKKSSILFLMLLSLCISLLSFPNKTRAAAVLDSPPSSNGLFNIAGVSSISWPHTVGSNLSRVLYVSVSTSSTTLPAFPSPRVTGVTFNSVPLTLVGTQLSPDNRSSVEIYRLINPPIGTNTIQVSLLAGTANYVVGGGTSYSGVNQTTPNGAFTSSGGTNNAPTIIVPDGVAGDLVLDTLATSPTGMFFLEGAGQTDRWMGRSFFSFAFDIGAGSTEPATSPVTMSWGTSGTDNWALAGIAVKALSPTAVSGTISGRVLNHRKRGIPQVVISLSGGNGEILTARTNPFGYFRFDDIELGNTFVLQAKSKSHLFAPQVISLNEALTEINIFPIGK